MPDTPPKSAAEARERIKAKADATKAEIEADIWGLSQKEFRLREGRDPNWDNIQDVDKMSALALAHTNAGSRSTPEPKSDPKPIGDDSGDDDGEKPGDDAPKDEPDEDPAEAITVILKRHFPADTDGGLIEVLARGQASANKTAKLVEGIAVKVDGIDKKVDHAAIRASAIEALAEWSAKPRWSRGAKPHVPPAVPDSK